MEVLKVLGSRLLVKRKESTMVGVKSDLILLPDTAYNLDTAICEVLQVGKGEVLENGEKEPMPVSPGDTIFSWSGFGEIVDEKERLAIIDISEVMAIVRED